jgi:serine/threonine-protein kinase
MTDRASAALSKGTATTDPLVGRVIGGRFKVIALIARGGMGKVYRAEQAPLGRICALKVLNAAYAGEHDPEFHKRFFLEASVASKLTHPNTVTIFDYGRTEDDVYYMAMEYLEGYTLHRAIREAGFLPEGRAVHIARQICRALREAHSLGVIHRDLKPANIFLTLHGDEADFVRILDFGLVKNVVEIGEDLTQTGMFMGSPKYMAPEQIRGVRVDARTDIYSLGIMLYEMLTGRVPFDRPNSVNILMAHVHEAAPTMREMNPAISVSRALEETVAACMEKDPARRLRSMDEVLTSLRRCGDPETSIAPAISGLEPTERASLSNSAPRLSRMRLAANSRSRLKAVLMVAAGFAGAGLIGYVAQRGVSSSRSPMRQTPAPVVTAVTVETAAKPDPVNGPAASMLAPAPPPALAPVKVRVNTDPDGASVKENGVELCSTPCDIVYEGDDADPAREHKLTFARQGYRAEVRTVRAGEGPVNAKLTPVVRAAPASPTKPPEMPAVPTGYKTDIPY